MTVVDQWVEKRASTRFTLDHLQLPLLGSRESDAEVFEYLILDLSTGGAKIALPSWLLSRINLSVGDTVNFHLPIIFESFIRSQGKVVWTHWDDNLNGQVCGTCFSEKHFLKMPIYLAVDTNGVKVEIPEPSEFKTLLLRSFKDSRLLKKGIQVYFKHLISFFSRFSGYSEKEFPMLREVLFRDIESHIKANEEKLKNFYSLIDEHLVNPKDIPVLIDLEEIRAAVESEIYPEIFNMAFETRYHLPYVAAIKNLEKTLYNHYNRIVLIYLCSMSM